MGKIPKICGEKFIMYYIKKRIYISASHSLKLDYESPCSRLHGHNWVINVYCKSKELNKNGMVIDFSVIKKATHGILDHQNINDILPEINSTAENLAKWICDNIPYCYKVEVQETEGNIATYEK